MTAHREEGERSAGLGRIDYSQAPKAVYYIASTGDKWRVHDCAMIDGKLRRVGLPGAERATSRVFVGPDGVKKLYRRQPREIWEATPAHLDRQLVKAEYLPTETFNPRDRDPDRR